MADVGVSIQEILDLPPFHGAECRGVSPAVEAYSVRAAGDRVTLLDAHAVLIAEIVEYSDEPAFVATVPHIALAPESSCLSAISAVSSELNQRINELAERSHAILQALTNAELQGSTLGEIVALLERLVGNPVILKDASHRVLAWSGQPTTFDLARQETLAHGEVTEEVLQALTNDGILDRIRDDRTAFRIERNDRVGLSPRVICPVRAGDIQFGYLSISEGLRDLDALDLLAVGSGANVIAFHMSRERAVEESVRSQHTLLLYDLLYSPQGSDERRSQQASMLGFDINRHFTAIAIRFDHSKLQDTEPDRWRRQINSVVATAATVLERIGVKSNLAMAEEDGVLIVVPSDGLELNRTVTAILSDIRAHQRMPDTAVGLSQSRQASLGLGDSYDEARVAAKLGRMVSGAMSVTRYSELGVLRLLNEMNQEAVDRHVAATLTDDQGFQEQFFQTFGAYADTGYNKAAAARRLFIHVNTLKYRLGRIRTVTGHNPTEHHGRFALECTLRLLELRRARANE